VGEIFDLAIIGGGINGAALAELAAHSGCRVALLEKTDFGAGVTSRSTRLIHGGLRYLEHGHVGVVRESLREREALMEDFPGQVRPLPFLIPIYAGDSRSPLWVRVGLEA
jgi:glycerol-3-phosphate dehydrogenase